MKTKQRAPREVRKGKDLAQHRRGGAVAACAAGVLLPLITFVAYLPALRAGYVWDDDVYVQHELVRSPGGLGQIWSQPRSFPQYYPLVYTTFWLEHRWWGDQPAGYHAVNVVLHGLVAVLLWRLLRRVGVPGAWVAAAIFALHPVQAESVAWITERKNVLSGIFYFGAALAYLRFALPGGGTRGSDGPRAWGWYAAALGMFAAALLSKTVTCTLPAVLLLIVWWRRGRLTAADGAALGPMFVLGIGLGLYTTHFEMAYTGATGEEWNLSWLERCLIAGRVPWFYAAKLLLPVQLTFVYPRWQIEAGAWWQYVFPLAGLGVLLGLLLLRRRIGWGPLVAALCFVGTLFPAMGFFNVYYMRYSFVADHWQYLASAALIALGVAVVHRGLTRTPALRAAAAAVVLMVLGVLTWSQAAIYADQEQLWRDVLRKNAGAWMAHNNLGNILRDQGQLAAAAEHYQQALAARPGFALAHSNLGIVRKRQNRLGEAVEEYRRAIQADPQYADAHYNLGIALQAQNDLAGAAAAYVEALRWQPEHAKAHVNLGMLFMRQGRPEAAVAHFERALATQPMLAEAHVNLGIIRYNQKQFAAAAEHCAQAIQCNPGMAMAHYQAGLTAAALGRWEAAAAALERTLQLEPQHGEAQRVLADLRARQSRRP